MIVPFAAGGPADITGRIVADIFSKALGQQFVVENVAGAGGATGTTRAARAAPDGYTIALGHMGTHAAAVALTPNLAYKPDVDFEPISLTSTQPVVRGDPEGLPRQQPAGVRGLRQGERRQAEHGARRRRLGVLHELPAAQSRDRHQDHDGAVHRHRAGA